MNEEFVRNITTMRGEEGSKWLESLPGLLASVEKEYSLEIFEPFHLTYNYVAPAETADGTPVVVKIGLASDQELQSEMEALEVFSGDGVIRLIGKDSGRGLLLLERALPGQPLSSLEDDVKATAIAIDCMKRMWKPAPIGETKLISISQWAQGLDRLRGHFSGTTGPLPEKLVKEAESLFQDLSTSADENMVLHGDYHHDNILTATRQPWLVIDPKGLIGDPAYEVGAFLQNPIKKLKNSPNLKTILSRRVDQLADGLGFEKKRIKGWGIYCCVLSAWWSIEDHGEGWEYGIHVAEILSRI